MRALEPYHYAWLGAHPERTEEWLRRMMAEGFHIHHIDADHYNNDPMNLVLIEGADHLFLHGMNRLKFVRTRGVKSKRISKKKAAALELIAMKARA